MYRRRRQAGNRQNQRIRKLSPGRFQLLPTPVEQVQGKRRTRKGMTASHRLRPCPFFMPRCPLFRNKTANTDPSSGFAALTHLPPQGGRLAIPAIKPSPWGEGSDPLVSLSLPLRGKVPNKVRRMRGSPLNVSFPTGSLTASPSSEFAALTHLPPRGKARYTGH